MAARTFMDAPVPVDNKTATAILQYKGVPSTVLPTLPQLPIPNDTKFALDYDNRLKSLNTPQYPAKVPAIFSILSVWELTLALLAKMGPN